MKPGRKILIVVGILLVVAVLVPIIHHYQLRAATEAYMAQLKAEGEPLELAQVIPPPVPPEKNAAPLITNALVQIYSEDNYTNSMIFNNPPDAMNRSIPGKEMIGWRQPVIHSPDSLPRNLTNTWDELGAQLAARQNDLNDFRKLIENPMFDFNFDYSDPKIYIPVLAPRLSQIKLAVQWLEASEYYNLHLGNTTGACTDVRAMLALVKGQTNERFWISQLVRFALAQMIADATWDILQTTNAADENLALLQRDWQSLEFISPLTNAFLFERVVELRLVNNLRLKPEGLDSQVSWTASLMPGREKAYHYERTEDGHYVLVDKRSFLQKAIDGVSTGWDEFRWRWFWSYADEVRGIRMWRMVIHGTQMMETNHSSQSVQAFLKSSFSHAGFDAVRNDPYALISQYANDQLAAIRKAAGVETARNIVDAAIALKRYEIQHHHYPNRLDEMVPDLLKSVPMDFMDGQPLRYRRNADGTFLLYSVGLNGKDDGGNPSFEPQKGVTYSSFYWQNPRALDWVWPQPATPEEVQKFYGHPPK